MVIAKSEKAKPRKSGKGNAIGAVVSLKAQQPIQTKQDLIAHLVVAAQIELSTIPLYLYALYSMKGETQYAYLPGESAFTTIRGVVIEEMLHLSLVRNMLISIGGGNQLRFYNADFIPKYPGLMYHRTPDLWLRLRQCSVELMNDTFLPLELPQKADAPPQPDYYNTLGQLYDAVRLGFETLAGPQLFDSSQFQYELNTSYFNEDGGGDLVCVTDLVSVLASINTIVSQGEGAQPGVDYYTEAGILVTELAHYYRFQQIADGVNQIGNVWPVVSDPKTSNIPAGAVRDLSEFFNACYCYLLLVLDNIFTSSNYDMDPTTRRSRKRGLIEGMLTVMSGMLYPVASLLVQQPLSGMQAGFNAGPSFEFYQFKASSEPKDQLLALGHKLVPSFPGLAGDGGVLSIINIMPSVRPVPTTA